VFIDWYARLPRNAFTENSIQHSRAENSCLVIPIKGFPEMELHKNNENVIVCAMEVAIRPFPCSTIF